MTPNLTRYLNQPILVSIPALFEDGRCRQFRLMGAEIYGLWLQSEELTQRLYPEKRGEAPAGMPAFVPFAQIGAVLMVPPAQMLPGAQKQAATKQSAQQTSKANPAADDSKPETKSKAKSKK